ncbi:MAG: lipocalin family protein [Deltaproteobacteria bacterium]|nr:lipocalin family protein [Deltaproteobacteria bacterium]
MGRSTLLSSLLALLLLTPACPGPGGEGGGDGGSDGGALPDGGSDGGAETACDDPVPAGRVTLPQDDGSHAEPTEWWYWTGHLDTAEGRYFGFEFAFFLQDTPGGRGSMVHHALTDLEDGTFHHTSGLELGVPPEVPGGFDLALNGQTMVGGGGHDVLHGEVDGYLLDLRVDAIKRPVLQHGVGYVDYPFGGYTYYYSRERMSASGTVTLPDGTVLPVTGTSWFDHQWGPLGDAIDLGWDWFALQLDDDREIMIFVVRDLSGDLLVGGSLTGADCETTEIGPSDFSITPKRTWTSPNGDQATYPLGWTITVFDETFEVEPVMDEQEVDAMFFWYWEGAATVSGDATGRAYIELTGY